eukprot:XP_014067282.1 PREDICTED: uncharacterized protein LOC106611520 [Salmo salar]
MEEYVRPDAGGRDVPRSQIPCAPSRDPLPYLHPNAEIGFLTIISEKLFCTVQPKESDAAGGGGVSREKVKGILDEILEKLPDGFNMIEVMGKVEERTPYIIVAFQECEKNFLTKEITRSLKELSLGLKCVCRGMLGHPDGDDSGRSSEGADPQHACDLHQGSTGGPSGDQERERRVSHQQDLYEGPHHLDLQPQDQGEACQVGIGRSLLPAQCATERREREKHKNRLKYFHLKYFK